jgi:hypothetical protein
VSTCGREGSSRSVSVGANAGLDMATEGPDHLEQRSGRMEMVINGEELRWTQLTYIRRYALDSPLQARRTVTATDQRTGR